MLSKVKSMSLQGLDGFLVDVQVDVSSGMPNWEVVGLPDATVKESKERVRTAIKNSGYEFESRRIVINLAPADKRKEGSFFDLPIAIGILLDFEDIMWQNLEDTVFIAENGRMNPVFTIDLGRKAGTQNNINITAKSTLLPDKILTSINTPKPIENGIIRFISSGTVITDRESGEAYKCVIINDYLGTGELSPSPSYGHLIHSYDPVSFRETATTALENGSLSDAAKDKIRTILSDLSDDDNNILVLYKIK